MEIDELHKKFVEYGRSAQEWKRKCLMLLPEIQKFEVWKKKGFNSIYEYAAKLAGIGQWQVDDTLRIIRKIEDKPVLIEVAQKKGLAAVRPVATIASKETAKYWAKQASVMSKNELELFVREVRRQENSETAHTDLKTLTIQLKSELVDKLEKMSNGDWNTLIGKFIELYELNLEEEKPDIREKASRHIPQAIKEYVLRRSNSKCEFPFCNKFYQHLHHGDRYASIKSHDPDRIFALCGAHHKLAHRGLIENENLAVKFWKVREEPVYTELNWFIDRQLPLYRRA